ncbi:protein IMPACT-like isoform X2 [Chelonus insularis]|nr:protein IMPACT-like isoform X2 [Chelonus insularis]XP_034939366.1 protein IMPACT-like isoform X2 [Chelonus insularis]
MNIRDGDKFVKLYVKLSNDYPSSAPPYYELSAPHLNFQQKNHICQLLEEVYLSAIGEPILYAWIERIREELQINNNNDLKEPNSEENDEKIAQIVPSLNDIEECPKIYHGDVIVDRKSSFQGHAAQVFSVKQVKLVLKSLLEIKKIDQATHNIYAYRILNDDTKIVAQDCEDDGESQAGGRLLHLLQIVDVKNVIVVVSRWYGGIHLGPDRFRHINNAARQALETANLISRNKDHKK